MSWLTIITALLRLVGLVETADRLYASYEAKKRAQRIADVPKTKDELISDLDDGKL